MKVSFGSLQANSWGKTFLRHLRKEVEGTLPGETRPLLERVRDAAQKLFDAEIPGLGDDHIKHLPIQAFILLCFQQIFNFQLLEQYKINIPAVGNQLGHCFTPSNQYNRICLLQLNLKTQISNPK